MLDNQKNIMEQLSRMEKNMERLAFNIDMDTVDISLYFPIKDNEMIHNFMSDVDGTFNEKRRQFEFLMYSTVTNQKSMKRAFGESLKSTLFTREYVATHRWPTAG